MGETIVSLKNITKYFPGVTALRDVSLDLKKGKLLDYGYMNKRSREILRSRYLTLRPG